jgi:anaerobic C4-dicarboxylate transporter
MHENSSQVRRTERTQTTQRSESPLPDVPFMGIAAFLGLIVLVLVAVAAYSLSTTFDGLALDSTLWAPAIFMLAVGALFWTVDRYQPRTHEH